MPTNPASDALLRETRAALDGLATALPAIALDSELILVPLERIGDSLRLGIGCPRPLIRWLDCVPAVALSRAMDACRVEIDELAAWTLPALDSDGDQIAWAVRRRDQAESVTTAVLRACMPRDIAPCEIHGFVELRAALTAFDAQLMAVASRAEIVAMLGERAAMAGAYSWVGTIERRVGA